MQLTHAVVPLLDRFVFVPLPSSLRLLPSQAAASRKTLRYTRPLALWHGRHTRRPKTWPSDQILPGKRFSADCNALKFLFEKIPGPPLLEDIGAFSIARTLLRRNGRGQFVANIFGRTLDRFACNTVCVWIGGSETQAQTRHSPSNSESD